MFISELKIDYEQLKAARGSRKPSEVAKEIGISRQQLWMIESGKVVPSGEILAKLCWLYDRPIKDFTRNDSF